MGNNVPPHNVPPHGTLSQLPRRAAREEGASKSTQETTSRLTFQMPPDSPGYRWWRARGTSRLHATGAAPVFPLTPTVGVQDTPREFKGTA